VPLLCSHGVWGNSSTGDSGAMACRAGFLISVFEIQFSAAATKLLPLYFSSP